MFWYYHVLLLKSSTSTWYAKSTWYVMSHALSSTHLVVISEIIVLQLTYSIKCIHTQGEYKLYTKIERRVCIQLVNKRENKNTQTQLTYMNFLFFNLTYYLLFQLSHCQLGYTTSKGDICCYYWRHSNFSLSPLILTRCMVFSLHYDRSSSFIF